MCFSELGFVIIGMESDDEIRRVPEMGAEAAGMSVSGRETGSVTHPDRVQGSAEGTRRKGKNPADKENKRLKRYLIYFVSDITIILII